MAQELYKYKEFPRVVYGPDGDELIIKTAEERPDGYTDYPEGHPLHEAKPKKADTKAEKLEIMAYLDEHNVDYGKNLSVTKLRALKKELDYYLTGLATEDTAEQ